MSPVALGRLEANVWKLYAIRMLFWTHFFSAVLVPFYTKWGGIRLSDVLILNAWFMLCSFLLEMPTGTVADYLSRRTSLALGSLVAVGAAVAYVSAPRFSVFMAAEAAFAVAYTLHSGADEALAYESLKSLGRAQEAQRVLARMESFKLGGIITGAVAGGFIARSFGLPAPMLAYVAPAGVALLIALSLDDPMARTARADGERSYGRILLEGGRYFLAHKVVRLLAFEAAVTNALAWGLIWLFQPLLERAGVSLAFFGVVQGLGCVGQIAFLSTLGRLESLLGSMRRVLTWSGAGAGISFILLGNAAWPPLVVLAIVAGFSFGLPRAPIFNAYINHHVSSEMRATVLSSSSMCRTLLIVIFNPAIGWMAERSLSWTMTALGVGLVAVSSLSRIEERHLQAPPQEDRG